jgi:putative transposase
MNNYNPHIHHRRSIRLKGYDYAQAGLYFITICCQDRAFLFGEVVNGEMKLNAFGEIAWQEWLATEKIRDNAVLHEFIVMPNHIHGIIEITFKKNDSESEIGKFKSPSQSIGAIIRGYKIATIKKIKERILNSDNSGELEIAPSTGELQFAPTEFAPTEKIILLDFKIWQRNYYEHIIRNELAYQNISNYIINNPAKWTEDKFYEK